MVYFNMDEAGGSSNWGEERAVEVAANFLQVPLSGEVSPSVTELRPLELYAPRMKIGAIHLTRLWTIQLGEQVCAVIQGIEDGKLVFIAR